MAIAMALHGGLGLIHCNMPERQQLSEVSRVKNNVHGLIQEPIKVSPDRLIGDVLETIEQKGYVSARWDVHETGREAKFYKLTRAGRKQLETQEASWDRLVLAIAKVRQAT